MTVFPLPGLISQEALFAIRIPAVFLTEWFIMFHKRWTVLATLRAGLVKCAVFNRLPDLAVVRQRRQGFVLLKDRREGFPILLWPFRWWRILDLEWHGHETSW
jgi:hypothetical protein